jgi:SWI/SNF-related matrix-associated actin-dependent regulator 1 of chromatin subfamily A
MNNAGYKTYLQWKNSRSGTTYLQYNDSKHILNATESSIPPTKQRNRSTSTNRNKSQSKKSKSKSNFFRKKYSKMLERPIEKVITFQLVDEKRVDVNLSFFPEPNIISIFREHQTNYIQEIKEWTLPFTNYISLFNTLMNLRIFKLNPIPANTIDIMFEKKLEQLKFLNQPDNNSKSKKVIYIIDYTSDIQNPPKLNDLPKALLKNLYRFQKQGIIFGIKKYSRLLIADEMGVGKTVQAIGLSCLYQKDWPVLVICPSSLKFAWRDEITLWLGEVLKKDEVQVIKHSKNEFKEDKKYYIISYDLSVRMIDKIIEKKFNYIIADEAHYLKSRSAKRTMSLTPILQRSKRVVLLTGTPILAKPMEIFSLLHILRPDKFKGFKEFGTRYCDPKMLPFGLIDWSGSSNSRELNSILNKLMIRRLKKDVLSQLPPKKRQKIEIATDSKVIKRLKIFMEKSSKKFEELLGTQIELDKLGINAEDINISNKKEKDSDNKSKDNEEESILNKFNKAYSMTGEAKLPGIRDYVNYLVDNSCKFLIFAHHSEVLDAIEDVIIDDKIGYIRIDGKVAIDKRQDLVNKFQTDEECLVAILSITACATGLTLTKASTVVFAELHFTPSIMIQAEDRAHRIGQDAGCVNIHYLVGEDTLDVLLFRKLNEKQNIVSTTLDNKSKDLNVTKIKEQVGDFINMNGKQISVDERKNITQVVDKSNATIISYLSSKNRINNNEIDNDIKIEEKEYNSVVDVNNKEIMKNMNLHEINGRRSSLKEEEEKKDNVYDNKEKKKRKKKGKKNDKNKNKNMTNYLDEKENKSENNNINEENKILNDKQIIEDMDKDKFFEEEKEIENIYGDEIKSENDKLFEDKVLMDIFDFNKL